MSVSRAYIIALAVIALGVASLLFLGLRLLFIPKIFLLAQGHNPVLPYEGPTLIFAAVTLAWFRQLAVQKLLWVCVEMQRLLTGLCIMAIMGIESVLHLFNIPHLEGWWVSIISGGAIISFISAWFQKIRKSG